MKGQTDLKKRALITSSPVPLKNISMDTIYSWVKYLDSLTFVKHYRIDLGEFCFVRIKGRGILVTDRKKYREIMNMLNTKQLLKLNKDPLKKKPKNIETKVQRAVRKIKDHLSTSDYERLLS